MKDNPEIGLLHNLAEPTAQAGIDECARYDSEEGGQHVAPQPDPNQCGYEVDEPEREDRHQPEDQQIAERISAKPGLQFSDKGPGALGKTAQTSTCSEKDAGRAERGADDRSERPEPSS